MIGPFLSAIAFVLALPTPGLWWLGFFSLVPLLVSINRCKGLFQAFLRGFLFGGLMFTGLGHWLYQALVNEYEKPAMVAVAFLLGAGILPQALLFGFFALCLYWLAPKKAGLFYFALVAPATWTLFEYLKEILPFFIPWGSIGYALAQSKIFSQSADIWGLYGLCFLAAAVNGIVALLLILFSEKRAGQREQGENAAAWLKDFAKANRLVLAALLLALLLPGIYGIIRPVQIKARVQQAQNEGQALCAVIVQASFGQKERWSGMGFYSRVKTHLDMSQCRQDCRNCIVVWPETVLNSTPELTGDFFRELIRQMGPDRMLITGGLRVDPQGGQVFNSAYFLPGNGPARAYDKNILLPWAENAPFDVLGTYYNAPANFLPGKTSACVETPFGAIGVSICFESIYPRFVAKSLDCGAGILVNISNDTWFGNSAMPFVHLLASQLRAVENRRMVLRASNSGISAVITPLGEIAAKTGLFEMASINQQVVMLHNKTIYQRLGDWICLFALFVLLFALWGRINE
ncbi:MAG: apolipoprotein N-acyltransferase [Desulfatibacillaceae bacterium]|nr:apolipoprotein N-acyltransferase [Desulfatibacillaceae bacterium]